MTFLEIIALLLVSPLVWPEQFGLTMMALLLIAMVVGVKRHGWGWLLIGDEGGEDE